MDPDEVVLRDPAEWARILASAQPVVIHVMDTLAAGQNTDDPKVKTDIAAQVLPLIEDVPSPIERDAYRQRLARLLRVDERALLGSAPVNAPRPGGRRTQPRRPAESQPGATLGVGGVGHSLERYALRLLLRQPEAIYQVDRTLQQAGLGRVSQQDFEHSDHQLAAKVLLQSLDQDNIDPLGYIEENIPESLRELFNDLQQPLAMGEPTTERLVNEVIGMISRLRHLRITESINQLRYLQEESQGEEPLDSYHQAVIEYTRTLVKLNKVPGLRNQMD
jgi:DNA primase